MTTRTSPSLLHLAGLALVALPTACAGGTETAVSAESLCSEVATAICDADAHCFPAHHPSDCVSAQTSACRASVRPLVEDPRLGFDPVAAGRFVASLHTRGQACWAQPVDFDAFTAMFTGTGAPGADCTPRDLSATSLRSSALSCGGDTACRLYLQADGSTQGVCERRTDASCSHAFDCGGGQFCDLPARWQPGVWGTCRPLRSDGWACGGDLECASRHCEGVCGAIPADQRPLVVAYDEMIRGAAPLAYLRFDESTGTIASDAMGGTHPGQLMGAATRDPHGAIGAPPRTTTGGMTMDTPAPVGAVHLADGGYVRIAAIPALADSDELTLECWFRPENVDAVHPILELADAQHTGPHVWQFNAGDRIYANLIDATRTDHSMMSDAGAISANAWHHVVASYDGASGALYLDGHRVGSTGMSGPLLVNGDLYVGHRNAMGMSEAVSFLGSIDEVAVYDHALSAGTVSRHHAAAATGTVTNTFMLYRWL